MDPIIARMLDANANRAREALRVLEDYARFGLNDEAVAGELKGLRHEMAAALKLIGSETAILSRDTPGDVGTSIKTEAEARRAGLGDVVIAAGKRLSEALRVLEECAKTQSPPAAQLLERLRYRGYTIEQTLTRAVRQVGRFAGVRLYVLLTESLCKRPWEGTLDAILGAGSGASLAVQLREKDLADAELLRRARMLVDRCHRHNALAIINDRPDIAILAGADGVHLGQTDLPCDQVRKLVGHDLIVGVSTECLDQAKQAVRDGATYIGVGPMFPTTTKDKPRIAGPAYAQEALASIPVPCVAIGRITVGNVGELAAIGVKCVAVCSAIIAAADPEAACHELQKRLEAGPIS